MRLAFIQDCVLSGRFGKNPRSQTSLTVFPDRTCFQINWSQCVCPDDFLRKIRQAKAMFLKTVSFRKKLKYSYFLQREPFLHSTEKAVVPQLEDVDSQKIRGCPNYASFSVSPVEHCLNEQISQATLLSSSGPDTKAPPISLSLT